MFQGSFKPYLLYNFKPFDSVMHFPSRVRFNDKRSKKVASYFPNTQEDMVIVDPKEIKASLSLLYCSHSAVFPIL